LRIREITGIHASTLVPKSLAADYLPRFPQFVDRFLETKTNGWHDLSVVVAGEGILSAYDAKLSFDGTTYPTNPSTPPATQLLETAPGKVVIAPPPSRRSLPAHGPKADIEQVLHTQQDAWNHHDLKGFMTGYWNSPELTFFSGAKENRGWQAALDHYRATYASPGHEMGKLEFSNLRIEMLGPEAAFVRGEFHLTMPDGKTPLGLFTLVFRNFPDGWKIVHDHASAAK
jgi:beta-aspartyl-peptidase (threonine type)